MALLKLSQIVWDQSWLDQELRLAREPIDHLTTKGVNPFMVRGLNLTRLRPTNRKVETEVRERYIVPKRIN